MTFEPIVKPLIKYIGRAGQRVLRKKMPPRVKPILKPTQQQWRQLMERVMLRGDAKGTRLANVPNLPQEMQSLSTPMTEGPISTGYEKLRYARKPTQQMMQPTQTTERMGVPQAAQQVLGHEPAMGQKRLYSRLYEPAMRGGELASGKQGRIMDLPFGEATRVYKKELGDIAQGAGKGITAEAGHIPPVDILSMGKAMGEKPTYQRRTYRPVQPVADRAIASASAFEQDQAAEAALKVARTKRRGEKALKGIQKSKLPTLPADELYNQALMADRMWRELVGGLRTTTGKMWNMWREARGAPGRQVKSAEEYFKRCFFQWYDNPQKFAKTKPREADSLKRIWKEFTVDLEGGAP